MGSAWPSADWNDWPETRITALINGLILLIAWTFGYWRWNNKIKYTGSYGCNDSRGDNIEVFVVREYVHKIWPYGIGEIHVMNSAEDEDDKNRAISVIHCGESTRGCCCIDFWNSDEPCKISAVNVSERKYKMYPYWMSFAMLWNSVLAIAFG